MINSISIDNKSLNTYIERIGNQFANYKRVNEITFNQIFTDLLIL